MLSNNYDFEAAKALIDDTTNITETNPLKDLFQICVKLALVLASIYFFVFISSGIIIHNLPINKQIDLENILAEMINKPVVIEDLDSYRLSQIKNQILDIDKQFPITSNLNIKIVNSDKMNALCYPNGNIYITSALYNQLKNDEMLTFVIAHEMAHYKNKDHLMNIRKNIAASTIVVLMSIVTSKDSESSTIVKSIISLSDLKYSRSVEAKSDIYAAKILLKLYGDVNGGVETLETLKKDEINTFEFFSTHPNLNKRISKLKTIPNTNL